MATIRTYIIGFALSIILTLIAFGAVWKHVSTNHTFPSHEFLIPTLVVLAIAQLMVQLVFFLHVGKENKPRWNFMAFVFAVIIVAILVGGTLSIMNNLAHGQAHASPDVFTEENISPNVYGK